MGVPRPPRPCLVGAPTLLACSWSSCLLAVTQAHSPGLASSGQAMEGRAPTGALRPVLEAGAGKCGGDGLGGWSSWEKSTGSLVWAQEYGREAW